MKNKKTLSYGLEDIRLNFTALQVLKKIRVKKLIHNSKRTKRNESSTREQLKIILELLGRDGEMSRP